ncbi:MAG: glycogen debranching protein [Algoriphagus sp.]|uniref:alpha-L-rhamnosidase-related protein n=1 Tax=Algoriphagus sp. TaxID=1872435 RepID=UPI002731B3D4|nr:glycogen debranching protein [Algoriphagus sp.]MDP2042888.1 glycogen debranching protein [Algoriphagus sp.]MDP3470691.1 glycogen debranching protein [Algoriphagus sp.]
MRFLNSIILISLSAILACTGPSPEQFVFSDLDSTDGLSGKKEYLASPFTAAGDRVYLIGHQDGTFPDLGWHVDGEMGGIWLHPIKLMDGFTASVGINEQTFCLNNAESFTNYPFSNVLKFPISEAGIEVERLHFVPDGKEGMVILFKVKNVDNSEKKLRFDFNAYVDLMPVWLGERTGMLDNPDEITFDEQTNTFTGKDQGNDWYVVWGSAEGLVLSPSEKDNCSMSPKGKGTNAGFGIELMLPASTEQIIPIYISGSTESEIKAMETLADLRNNLQEDWTAKRNRYKTLQQSAQITIPDKELQKAFEWVKYNTDWLVRDVPGMGRGFGAGLQDYPWFFGVDSEYTIQGLITTGRKDLVYSTLDLIHNLSEKANGNGRIIHEVSTNGAVFNPGNINETPQWASTVWEVYRWTGDRELLEKYFPSIEKGLHWLLSANDKDGNLLADGYGMMEIHGLESEMIDVAVYSQKAFADAAKMAEILGKNELAKSYQQTAAALAEKINADFWVAKFGSYADFIGTAEDALHLIEGAIIRADTLNKPWAVAELQATKAKLSTLPKDQKQGFVLYHNWVVNTPMETGVADPEKAKIALETGRKYTNPFGVFVTGIDRDESAENEDGAFTGSKMFSYTGAVMTLPTGVSAIGENNYGNPDGALDYLKRMTRSFGFALPGSIYEVSPDYGMFTQAWNMYSYAVPIVTQFFGIRPDAGNKVIYIRPQMPSTWEEASIQKVQIGDNLISLSYVDKSGVRSIEVEQSQSKWGISIEIPESYTKVKILGKEVSSDTKDGYRRILMTGKKVRVEVSK